MSTPRILVVEDNPIARKMVGVTLRAEGWKVLEAEDASQALSLAREEVVDVALVDLLLPDADGVDVARRLRALPGGAELPILAVSGFVSRFEQGDAVNAVFTGSLIKPVEPEQLIAAIRPFLALAPLATIPPRGSGKVLVVDDDAVDLKLGRIQLGLQGYGVVTCLGSATAVEEARRHRPVAVVSDVLMPDLDGFQLCAALRKCPDLSDVPVILHSSFYAEPDDEKLARRVGASALVTKSPDFSSVSAALREALGAPLPLPAPGPSEVASEHTRRLLRQLERQAAANRGLERQVATQSAQLVLLGGMADALVRGNETERVLVEVFNACLDAAGISHGAMYLRDDANAIRLLCSIGYEGTDDSEVHGFFGRADLLEEAIEQGSQTTFVGEPWKELLLRAGVASAQVVPLSAGGDALGALFVGARSVDANAATFLRLVGVQMSQTIAVTRAFLRVTQSERRYRALVDNASSAIISMDDQGVIREINGQGRAIVGLAENQMSGRHFSEFITPGDRDRAFEHFRQIVETGAAALIELGVERADGTTRRVEATGTRVDIGTEKVCLIIAADVTERRLLEDELRQAQKMEAIGRLAGGVAHDFNNVLTAITSFATFAQEDMVEDDPRRRDIDEVLRAARRAVGLTQQLLAFSRKQPIQPRVVDLNRLLPDASKMLRRTIGEDIELVTVLADDPWPVFIDPGQFEQVVMNLAVNARDAMPRGGRLVFETANVAGEQSKRGDHVVLRVSDDGVGMSREVQAHLFQPFFTTKAPGEGTGLGLSTVYGLVKQAGGDVQVESAPGEGTCFEIWLPRANESREREGSVAPSSDALGGAETVLVVEDDSLVRAAAVRILEKRGYRVIQASDGAEALNQFRRHEADIDLLITDVVMPKGGGPEIAETLRAASPGLKVLFMTGYTENAAALGEIRASETAVLHKPFTAFGLLSKVRQLLDDPECDVAAAGAAIGAR